MTELEKEILLSFSNDIKKELKQRSGEFKQICREQKNHNLSSMLSTKALALEEFERWLDWYVLNRLYNNQS